MIGKEITRSISRRHLQFVINAETVLVFGERAVYVVHHDVESVVGEFCDLRSLRTAHTATERVIRIRNRVRAERRALHSILAVPSVCPRSRAWRFRNEISVCVVRHRGVRGRGRGHFVLRTKGRNLEV